MRKHGFQRPFHPLQITSWVVFTTDAAVFSVIGLPLLQGGEVSQAIVGVVYGISIVCLIFAWLKATWCDPSDPHLKRPESDFTDEEYAELPFCEDCNCPVFPRSKHCRACDKCVHVFDHHCKWLNNCVGQDNYRHFALAVSSVAVMTGIVLVCSFVILLGFILDEGSREKRLREVYGETPKEFIMAALITLVVVNLPLCLLDVQLLLFHVFLTTQQLTTFEYIVNKRELEFEEEEAAQNDETRKRQALPKCLDWIVYKKRKPKSKANTDPSKLQGDGPSPEQIGMQLGMQEQSVAPTSGGKSLNDLIMMQGHGDFGSEGNTDISGVVVGLPAGLAEAHLTKTTSRCSDYSDMPDWREEKNGASVGHKAPGADDAEH